MNSCATGADRQGVRKPKRERVTLDLDSSELYWTLVGETDDLYPVRTYYYLIGAKYLGDESWSVPSKRILDSGQPEHWYEVDLSRSWCSCPRNTHKNACGHVKAMRLRSKIQFAKPE